jgi:hypothetical protein
MNPIYENCGWFLFDSLEQKYAFFTQNKSEICAIFNIACSEGSETFPPAADMQVGM